MLIPCGECMSKCLRQRTLPLEILIRVGFVQNSQNNGWDPVLTFPQGKGWTHYE